MPGVLVCRSVVVGETPLVMKKRRQMPTQRVSMFFFWKTSDTNTEVEMHAHCSPTNMAK